MLTRTKTFPEEGTQEIPLPLSEEAKTEIHAKGFYLYKWISSEEIKTSIQRDYLNLLSYLSLWIGGFSILAGVLGGFLGFFLVLGFSILLIFFYIFFLTVRRSLLLTNTANVVLTDTAISFGGEIIPYTELPKYREKIGKWEKEFDEPLFQPSHIQDSKNRLFQKVVETIQAGWAKGFQMMGRGSHSRNSSNAMLFVILLGIIYTLSLIAVYIGGLFFIWIFSLGFMIVNRIFLRMIGHTVQRIHDLFTDIDVASGQLRETNRDLSDFFTDARENEWKDALLTKIQDGIKSVNQLAKTSLDDSQKLRKILMNSEYRDIFNFDTYSGWIRTQIILPLRDIRDLLLQNHLLITKTIEELQAQIDMIEKNPGVGGVYETSSLSALEAQRMRLEMQRQTLEKHGDQIEAYLAQLEVGNKK